MSALPKRWGNTSNGPAWAESPRLVCLAFDWSVQSDNPTLVDYITSLYEACLAPGPARHRFVLETSAPSRLTLARDGRVVLRHASPGLAVARLAWEVNRRVVEETSSRLLLHAAAVEREGAVVLLPGPRGAGKSTLAAALVRGGLRYVTDEAVAVDPVTTAIEPYAKPIALDRNSWPLLPDLRPEVDPAVGDTDQWLVAPRSIRPDAVAPTGGVPALVILPAHRPGRPTAAREIPRAGAAIALAEHSFNFRTFGPGALDAVANIVRGSRCYRLDVGDLDIACRVIFDLLESVSVRP